MRSFYQSALLLLLPLSLNAEPLPTAFKAAPTRPSAEANVIIEEQEILETCDAEQICVQGRLYNNGSKTAAKVKMKIEIGGTRHSKPRHTIIQNADVPTMAAGDRQEFYVVINRKIPMKDSKGNDKILEVGKYNFHITPVWSVPSIKPVKSKPKRG